MRGYIKLAGTAERKGEGGEVQIHVLFFKSFAFNGSRIILPKANL